MRFGERFGKGFFLIPKRVKSLKSLKVLLKFAPKLRFCTIPSRYDSTLYKGSI